MPFTTFGNGDKPVTGTKNIPTKEELEVHYNEITSLYDLAEELVSTVESPMIQDPEDQLKLVESLVTQVGETADILSEEFINIAENKSVHGGRGKMRIEAALRKVYIAMEDYKKRTQGKAKKAQEVIKNVADPIVKKIERQVQRVISIFVELIDLSLNVIMNPPQLQELKRKEANIALYLHNQAQHGHT